MRGGACGAQDQDVDQAAGFVDAQPVRVRLDVVIGGGGADREDREARVARVVVRAATRVQSTSARRSPRLFPAVARLDLREPTLRASSHALSTANELPRSPSGNAVGGRYSEMGLRKGLA